MPDSDSWSDQFSALGGFIRRQRNLANLSIRELADLASVSNAYLSQVERGLHEPSVRVLASVARALNVSAETLLAQAGLLNAQAGGGGASAAKDTETAILGDPDLSADQKQALLGVYRSYVAQRAKPQAATLRERKPRKAP